MRYLVPRNENKQVQLIGILMASVYTTDGYFLFDVARDQADYMVKNRRSML
ncbi:hypothetical protein MASR2M48_35160 [Spirochaetota bacterium]